VVLSYPIWKDLLQDDPGIIGRKVELEREPYIVIGVMARGFNFPMRSGHVENGQIWTPLHLGATELSQSGWHYSMVGRLNPGMTEVQAAAQLTAIQRRSVPGRYRIFSGRNRSERLASNSC